MQSHDNKVIWVFVDEYTSLRRMDVRLEAQARQGR